MCEEHMKMHTMIKNISLKDAHPSEPLHERSKGVQSVSKLVFTFIRDLGLFEEYRMLFRYDSFCAALFLYHKIIKCNKTA